MLHKLLSPSSAPTPAVFCHSVAVTAIPRNFMWLAPRVALTCGELFKEPGKDPVRDVPLGRVVRKIASWLLFAGSAGLRGMFTGIVIFLSPRLRRCLANCGILCAVMHRRFVFYGYLGWTVQVPEFFFSEVGNRGLNCLAFDGLLYIPQSKLIIRIFRSP